MSHGDELELLNHQYPRNSLVLEGNTTLGAHINSPKTDNLKSVWIHYLKILTFLRSSKLSFLFLAPVINQTHVWNSARNPSWPDLSLGKRSIKYLC